MKKILVVLLITILATLTFAVPVFAFELTGGEELTIPEDMVYNDNVIVGAGLLDLQGTVNGDVIAGGGYVTIEGTINGDLLIGGGRVEIRNTAVITGELWAIGGAIQLDGKIDGDVSIYGGQANISGEMNSLSAELGQLTLKDLKVLGDTDISAGILDIGPGTLVEGDLIYSSPNEVALADDLQVGGEITIEEYYSDEMLAEMESAEANKTFLDKIGLQGKVISYLMLLSIALILLEIAPNYTKRVAVSVADSFWKSIGLGLLALIIAPILIIFLLFTVVGIPLSVILTIIYILAIYLAPIWFSYWLGSLLLRLNKKKTLPKYGVRAGALALGLLIYKLITLIPVLSTLVYTIVLLSGFGALLLTKYSFMKEAKKKGLL